MSYFCYKNINEYFFYYWFGVHFCKNIHRYCWILVFLSTFYPLGECQGTWADVWLIHRYSLQHRNAIQEGAQWWCMSTIVASSQSQVNCVRIFFSFKLNKFNIKISPACWQTETGAKTWPLDFLQPEFCCLTEVEYWSDLAGFIIKPNQETSD